MIDINRVSKYCCEDPSLIENYEEAIKDNETWDCHHRKENDGTSQEELIKNDLYFQRPASELIFLTKSDHITLHNNLREWSEETRQKLASYVVGKPGFFTGKHHTDEAKKKMSEKAKLRTGEKATHCKPHSEETKRKISEAKKGKPAPNKGKHWKYIDGKMVYY